MGEYSNINFKKKFGQNFLQDNNIIKKIVESTNIEENALIIEIGPGRGALTKELIKKGQVLAYEIDTELKEYLESGEIEELADLEEVLLAILDAKKITYKDFTAIREQKVQKRGAFKERIFLESVEEME